MNIRNLLLGSVAAAGLSTGAYAADLGVLTSLDVCDALGLSGLTISSDTNCLQITGEVKYKFTWGDYNLTAPADADVANEADGDVNSLTWMRGSGDPDWASRFDAWIKFVATADSDFGPAKAVIKLKEVNHRTTTNGGAIATGSSDTGGVVMDEAYVSIGDSTVIMAGKKGSILNKGDDVPLNWLGLFISEKNDAGVTWGNSVDLPDGGHVIQVVSDLGNGFSVAGGLEALNADNADTDTTGDFNDGKAGTAVGVIAYAGDGLSAHASFAAGGVLDGTIEDWGVHAGFSGTFDNFKVVAAGAFGNDDDEGDYWNVLGSVSATFDMFTIAGSVEANSNDQWGVGASASAAVTDGVTLNVGGRYLEESAGNDIYQVAASVVAAVTETITITGEVGYVDDDWADLFYGSAKLAWAPGGGFTSSVKGTVNSEDAYKIETEFKKTFE
ncbi:MAG: hypothetical protein IPK28_04320 [Devosia sp.]|nr:hypothetical protein [Devosia sp.]